MSIVEVKQETQLTEEKKMEVEEWRELEEFPGYHVSSFGRFRTPKGTLCEGTINMDGFIMVKVKNKDGVSRGRSLHILVATAFVPNPGHRKQLAQIDGNKQNTKPSNLVWGYIRRNEAGQPEIWKDTPGYPGYQISSHGRSKAPNGHISRGGPGLDGYICAVVVDEKGQQARVPNHILVAKTFLPNPHNYKKLEHINGNILCDDVSNLRWIPSLDDKKTEEKVEKQKSSRLAIWRVLEEYPGYKVSNKGDVMTPRRHIAEVTPDPYHGYVHVRIVDVHGRQLSKAVHILVALCFIPNPDPDNKRIVNHIDGSHDNNDASNLEWVDDRENALKAVYTKVTQSGRPVVQYDMEGKVIRVWDKIQDAMNKLHFTRQSISRCCTGIKESHAGFKWKYLDAILEFPGEEWVKVNHLGYSFTVSNYGRIHTHAGKRIFGSMTIHGYMTYTIDGIDILMHRLVALGFCSNPENKCYVDHINGVRCNNRADNLRWVTHSENVQHGFDIGTHKANKKVACYTLEGQLVQIYPSITIAADTFGVCRGTITNACKLDRTTTGYRWRFVE